MASTTFVRGSIYIFISLIYVKIFSLFINIAYARFLGPEDYGDFALILFIGGFFYIFGSFTISTSMTKFLSEQNHSSHRIIINTGIRLQLLFILIASAIMMGSAYFIVDHLYSNPSLLIPVLVYTIAIGAMAFSEFCYGTLAGYKEMDLISKIKIVAQTISFPIIIPFIIFLGLTGASFSYAIPFLVTIGFQLYYTNKYKDKYEWFIDFTWDKEIAKKILHFSLPLFISGLLIAFTAWLFSTIIYVEISSVSVGYYRIAFMFYNLVFFIPAAVGFNLVPTISSKGNVEEIQAFLTKFFKVFVILLFPLILLAYTLLPMVILLFFGEEYEGGTDLARIMMIVAFISSLFAICSVTYMGLGYTRTVLIFDIVRIVLTIIISLLLIKEYNILGIGVAYLISYVIATSVYYVDFVKKGLIPVDMNLIRVSIFSILIISMYIISSYYSFTLLQDLLMFAISIMLVFIITPKADVQYVWSIMKENLVSISKR